jgi:hypothetical protein
MSNGFGEHGETIIIVHPLERDEWGDPVPGTGTEEAVDDLFYAPGATREIEVNANQVQADGTVYGPPELNVSARDRMRIRGEEYVVAGKPRIWLAALIEVPVRLITG